MEIKDIMEQQIEEIRSLTNFRKILVERMNDYDKEHPMDPTAIINTRPNFGIRKIDQMISEKYNMIVEWLTEDMTEKELHDIYENDRFLDFWKDFMHKARYDQEQFIEKLNGTALSELYIILKHCDILEVAYKKTEDLYKKEFEAAKNDEELKDQMMDIGSSFMNPKKFEPEEEEFAKDLDRRAANGELKDEE